MFPIINKKDMEENVGNNMVVLDLQLEMEHAMKQDVRKQPLRRPKKEIEVVLLTTKVKEPHRSTPKTRIRGPHMNWFIRSLWNPI
jgi:hypothetical protein